jgi:hypothetical protein
MYSRHSAVCAYSSTFRKNFAQHVTVPFFAANASPAKVNIMVGSATMSQARVSPRKVQPGLAVAQLHTILSRFPICPLRLKHSWAQMSAKDPPHPDRFISRRHA